MSKGSEKVYPQMKHVGDVGKSEGGLTKREYFAGLAMQGLTTREGYGSPEMLSADAVAYADALLAALEESK